jgi:hypothetical protein
MAGGLVEHMSSNQPVQHTKTLYQKKKKEKKEEEEEEEEREGRGKKKRKGG